MYYSKEEICSLDDRFGEADPTSREFQFPETSKTTFTLCLVDIPTLNIDRSHAKSAGHLKKKFGAPADAHGTFRCSKCAEKLDVVEQCVRHRIFRAQRALAL